MAPVNSNKNPNIPKKQTGTVPKLSSIMMHNNSSNNSSLGRDLGIFSPSSALASSTPQTSSQQQQPQQKPLSTAKSTTTPTTSNKTKSSTSYRSGTSRKNTEIVAPTRRELNDLNDYLLITSVNSDPAKQQNNNHSIGHNNPPGIINTSDTSSGQQQLDSSCYDIENINFQENQRFCYPVRPIPRRSINKKQQPQQSHQHHQQNNLHGEQNLNISTSSSSAAVGVVIPTTPGNSTTTTNPIPTATASAAFLTTEDNYNLLGGNNISRVSSNTTYQNILCDQQNIINGYGNNHSNNNNNNTNNNINSLNNFPIDINSDLTWEERLNFIQYFLSVTSKLNNQKDIVINQFRMVNETGESKTDDGIVNSTSLEDVAHSESSDRAHSVSSIHTLSGAEPSTPNYEELQLRLESSNRNIQNIKDQQQQLLRLQQAAKQHLTDMEEVRTQLPVRFGGGCNGNGSTENGGAPDYESVEQVHSDMSALVNRMKNLQTFIQNQNELSVLLGEDSPDLLAEQELLQQKLNELKSHRSEMKNLVDELQNINTNAEKTISQQQSNENHHSENNHTVSNGVAAGITAPTIPNRVVPVEFQRVVPIELVGANKKPLPIAGNVVQQHNGHTDTEDDNDIDNDEMDSETANMIKQKVADINAMKQQLQRLKDMMATVKLIEEKTEGPSVKDIGREDIQSNVNRNSSKAPIEVPTSMQKDFTKSVKKAYENHENSQTAEEAAMSERVRLLHEMTDDLRTQAMSLTSERDRLKALREELKTRRDFEVQEKKNGTNKEDENVSARNTNLLQQKGNNSKSEQNTLEAEYEEKKKEFQRLCERLNSEEDQNDETATVTGNEDNEDLDDETNNPATKQDRNFFTTNWPRNANSTSCNSSITQEKNCSTNVAGTVGANIPNVINTSNRGKDSADSGAADVHANGIAASIEAGSMQSGSSRSFSMPPPMRSINNPVWRKNSHEHAHPHGSQPVGCEHYVAGPWNPYAMYQNPYGYTHTPRCEQLSGTGEYTCSNHAWNNLGMNTTTTSSNTPANTNDPVLLQQFIQTQQMLINSVCQCNQMLWHQQREINNLNNTVVMLQERILNATSDLHSLQGNNRSESVPPLPQNNNLYGISMNRANSEQPLHSSAVNVQGPLYSSLQQQPQSLSTPISPNRQCHSFNYNTSNNFMQQQLQQQRRHLIQNQNTSMTAGATTHQSMSSATSNYNYSTEQQSATNGIYTNQSASVPQSTTTGGVSGVGGGGHIAFNNGQPMNFLNNDPSHPNNHSAGPIFMNHHNNNFGGIGQHQSAQHAGNINNSNSNLLHQNATNSPTSTTTGALNNQVAPGTRANNYWDNFRSYSRQNLLSSNSCKSNEELNQQMQQQHQQQLQQQQQTHQQLLHQQQQQQSLHHHINNNTTAFNLSPIPSTSNVNIQNECRSLSSISAGAATSTTNLSLSMANSSNTNLTTNNSNNLNPSNYDSKYFHTFRNEFNSNNQQHLQQAVSTTESPATTVQPINLTTSTACATAAAVTSAPVGNSHSTNDSLDRTITQNVSAPTTTVPYNSNINDFQHLEVNQGGSASSNLSVADNLNENIFDFNSATNFNQNNNNNINNNNINNNNSNTANAASFFGSPDFRNMNFNFGLHEPKKVPMKTACTTSAKRLRQTQSVPNNSINSSDAGGLASNINGGNMGSQSSHNFSNNHNNEQYRYEEMSEGAVGFDETSEEIKRNLLVNALKSDKFTSKFFESLKEDVYRQAYAIIQEKKSDPQFLVQLFEEIKGAPAYDPLRNLLVQSFYNLNRPSANQHHHHHRTNNDTESNDGDNEMENEESSSAVTAEMAAAAADTFISSAGIQNYFKIDDNSSPSHSQNNFKHNQPVDGLFQRNSSSNISNNDNLRDSDVKPLFLNSKEYKFPHDHGLLDSNSLTQQKNKSNDLRNERINHQYQMRNFSEPRNDSSKKRPESHIISYTIFKIRKEIQKQQIDDATLLRIVKITIQTLENAISNLQQPSPVLAASLRSLLYRIKLSTKEIYAKMKNFQNQEKDNFLTNYQSYLNKLLLEDSNNINLAKPTRHFGEAGDLGFWQLNNQFQWNEVHNLPKQSTSYKSNISSAAGNEAKVMNSSDNQNDVNEIFLNLNQQNVHINYRHQQNQYQNQNDIGSPCTSSNNMMNEDLAEADQICSSNNQISVEDIDDAILENNNGKHLKKSDSNASCMAGACGGTVAYNTIQNSNNVEVNLILNDDEITTKENINDDPEEIRHYNGNGVDGNNEDHENNIIHCCDNDKVEDDQDVAAASIILINDSINISQLNEKKLTSVGSPLSNHQKQRSNNNRKLDISLENNENLNEFNQLTINNTKETSSSDNNYHNVNNGKSNNKIGFHNTTQNTNNKSGSSRTVDGGNCVTTNNACAYIFPISIQSDSMINNNLDSGYQSIAPQPDGNSSLSNSNTGSTESNECCSTELGNTNTNSGKRNSVP